MAALLRFYSGFTLDVDNMSEEELWKDWHRLRFVLEITGKMKES